MDFGGTRAPRFAQNVAFLPETTFLGFRARVSRPSGVFTNLRRNVSPFSPNLPREKPQTPGVEKSNWHCLTSFFRDFGISPFPPTPSQPLSDPTEVCKSRCARPSRIPTPDVSDLPLRKGRNEFFKSFSPRNVRKRSFS